MTEYITVGKLGRTRGVEGEIYITPMTDFPERFLDMTSIMVKTNLGWEDKKIASTRLISGRPVIKFSGINNPEDARILTNCEVGVPKDKVVKLPEDQFYIFDLVGLEVFDCNNNDLIGKIVAVETYPANDVYVIESAAGEKLYCPVVKTFVKDISLETGKVLVDPAGIFKD